MEASMQLDVGTIYLAGGLAGVIASGAIFTGNRLSSRHDGLASLTLASLLLAVGLVALGLHREMGDWLALGIGNPLLAASALAFRFALVQLQQPVKRTRIPQFTVAFVCLAEWASLTADTSGTVRACVGAAGTAAALVLPVPSLVGGREPWMGKARYVAAAAFLVASAASLARAFAVWADRASAPLVAPAPANTLFAVAMLGIVGAAAVVFLVMLREHQRARLQMLDGLTEIFNRDAFLDQARRVLSLGQRRDLACSAVLVNLDRFSRVNETRGYSAGDKVLRHIAAQARGVLRPEDLLGRSSSAEFALLLFATPGAGAQAVARRLKVALAAHPPRVGGVGIPVTASIGIAEWRPGSSLDASALLDQAGQAVREAKARGRDGIVRYDELAQQPAAP
jgi:diguanylate cyclase (GGDEF)-like protein